MYDYLHNQHVIAYLQALGYTVPAWSREFKACQAAVDSERVKQQIRIL